MSRSRSLWTLICLVLWMSAAAARTESPTEASNGQAPVANVEAAPKTDVAEDAKTGTDSVAAKESADSGENNLLSPDDPKAQQGEVIGARGIDPGWKDARVAERAPNLYGQTGLRRVTSARAGKHGYFNLGLSGRAFYVADFIAEGEDENTFVGAIEHFGVSLFDQVELGVATQLATNQNEFARPIAQFTTGDLLTSIKYSYSDDKWVYGADLRVYLPTSQDEVGIDWKNFSATLTGLFSVDFYEEGALPLRLHFNAGYTLQNAHNTGDLKYRADELSEFLLAMTSNQWFYDQLNLGVGVEALFPYITPYVEIWSQSSLFVPSDAGPGGKAPGLSNSHLILTPGARLSVGRGLNFDVALDLGILGTGGFLSPSIDRLLPGQPVNPAYAFHIGLSYTFSPFVAETQVEVREKKISLGRVKGCVRDKTSQQKIEDAIVEFEGTAGPRIVVDGDGCFVSPLLEPGSLVINVKHLDHLPGTTRIDIASQATLDILVELEPAPRYGRLEGFLTNQKDQRVDGVLVITDAQGGSTEYPAKDGIFDAQLAPGAYQVLIKAEKYLQQGAPISIEPLKSTQRNFVLKPLPRQRISSLAGGKIEIQTQIPFELGNARLLRAAEFILDDVVDVILSNSHFKNIRIEGHTDNQGAPEANLRLSAERAQAVRTYLVTKGIDGGRLDAVGFGAERPLTSNNTAKGRAINRRVEFIVVDLEGALPSSDSEQVSSLPKSEAPKQSRPAKTKAKPKIEDDDDDDDEPEVSKPQKRRSKKRKRKRRRARRSR